MKRYTRRECLLFGCGEEMPSFSKAALICEDVYYRIKIKPLYNGIRFWYTEKDDTDTFFYDLDFRDLKKLSAWADNLIECDGKYEHTRKGWTYDCDKIGLKGEMVKEYSDGWFCDRCRKIRIEKLKKKLDSLK